VINIKQDSSFSSNAHSSPFTDYAQPVDIGEYNLQQSICNSSSSQKK